MKIGWIISSYFPGQSITIISTTQVRLFYSAIKYWQNIVWIHALPNSLRNKRRNKNNTGDLVARALPIRLSMMTSMKRDPSGSTLFNLIFVIKYLSTIQFNTEIHMHLYTLSSCTFFHSKSAPLWKKSKIHQNRGFITKWSGWRVLNTSTLKSTYIFIRSRHVAFWSCHECPIKKKSEKIKMEWHWSVFNKIQLEVEPQDWTKRVLVKLPTKAT